MNFHSILTLYILLATISYAEIEREISSTERNTAIIAANEADQLVLTLERNKREAAAELKSSLERVPAYYQTETTTGERKILIRRVAAPAKLPTPKPKADAQATKSLDLSQWNEAELIEPIHIYLYATVYDDAHSRLILTHERKRYTVWTNLNFKYLQLLGYFNVGQRRYNYFGVTDQIDTEREAEIARFAREKGYNYTSRWENPPVPFVTEPEYILVTEDDMPIPEEVYQQLDALLGYYIANQEKLQLDYRNARQMQAARERYRQAHPEKPQDIVLNYSRMSTPTE